MNIQELRETKVKLEQVMNYCPPESSANHVWEAAEKRAMIAKNRLAKMETTFALLDAIDDLTARLERLERLTGYYVPEDIPDDPGEHFMDDDGRPRGYEDQQHAAEIAMEPDCPF